MDAREHPVGEVRRWQSRVFWSIWITYFAFYLCRYNMPVAKTRMCGEFSWDPEEFGIVLSALLAMYAVGQFVNGQLADRFGTRLIASLGVLGSVVMNLAVFATLLVVEPDGVDSSRVLVWIALFWGGNGFFQAMGWSPMVRAMTHWYPAERRGKTMGWLGTCYQLGAAFAQLLAIFLTGYFVQRLGGDWRMVFLVPALLFAAIGIFFFLRIRDRPEDVGLPALNVEEEPQAESRSGSRASILVNVGRTLRNPYLWIVAGTFFCLDLNRYGFVNWLPAFVDDQGVDEVSSLMGNFKKVMKLCIHPLAGSAGAVVAGWATDRFFGGRRAPVIVLLLTMLAVLSFVFPFVPAESTWLVVTVVALIGFCTYGPHILMVGHAAQDFGKKAGAAGAAGFIDGMGYIGASLAGWGAGVMINNHGYRITFVTFGCAALLGAVLAALIWKVDPRARSSDHESR